MRVRFNTFNMMGQTGFDHDQQQQNEPQGPYSNEGWVPMNNYPTSQHTSPIHEYSSYQYLQGLSHSMPVESSFNRMPPPPVNNHQPLLPLLMPSQQTHPTWPSMLTNPTGYVSLPPNSAPMRQTKLPTLHAPTPRKTLTDQDRRKMCQYHEDNPTVKQTEIGAMFGVERSTVSKVLRQKDKYLSPSDRSGSPVRKVKGKFPDIDRALSSWVRNHRKQGLAITDDLIREKARMWASTVGNAESHTKANSDEWLEKFKKKNNIPSNGKLSRRASETSLSDSGNLSSTGPSAIQTPNDQSPESSPENQPSSKVNNSMKVEVMDDYMSFASQGYRHNSQSSSSLSSAYTDTVSPGFPEDQSPEAPFNFSPETPQGPFMPSQYINLPPPPNGGYQRPRSQTVPMLNIDPSFNQNPENETPKFNTSVTAPSSAMDDVSSSFNTSSPALRHRSSSSSLGPQSTGSAMTSPPAGSPSSPTQDDAKRALETLLGYMSITATSGLISREDFMAVSRLNEKLTRNDSMTGSGTLARIPEQEGDGSSSRLDHRMSVGA